MGNRAAHEWTALHVFVLGDFWMNATGFRRCNLSFGATEEVGSMDGAGFLRSMLMVELVKHSVGDLLATRKAAPRVKGFTFLRHCCVLSDLDSMRDK